VLETGANRESSPGSNSGDENSPTRPPLFRLPASCFDIRSKKLVDPSCAADAGISQRGRSRNR